MIPQRVLDAWEDRKPAFVLTTVSSDGVPNSIWAISGGLYDRRYFVVADNYFTKTRANLESGRLATLLFITKDGVGYQIKGTLTYHTEGTFYDFMRTVTPAKYPRRGAAVLHVRKIYCGSEEII
jgi:predicted pyridoxine 5'-phosphate oxidase superfamily flavin-nucleotide-binding protein